MTFDELVTRQHGVFTAAQAEQFGVSRSAIAIRSRRGQWQRVHRRVYSTTSGPLSLHALRWAALLYADKPAWLSHLTAATIHGLRVATDAAVHVLIPHHRRIAASTALVLHRSVHIDLSDFCFRGGLPVTRVERTVVDCLISLDRRGAARALAADAVQRHLTTVRRLRAVAERLGVLRRSWIATLLADLDGRSQSELELLFLALCRNYGLPLPC